MKFFIDTAKVEDIKKANDMGVICGVTTNPSLIAKEGRVFEEVIAEIASIVDGPISGEVKATTVDAEGMIKEGRPYTGVLYAGLILTADGPKVIEFNSRFGDPETQIILPRLTSDFVQNITDILDGKEPAITWTDKGVTLGVVVASNGYPLAYEKGVKLPAKTEGDIITYYAGAKFAENGQDLLSNGGRVYMLVTTADTVKDGQNIIYNELNKQNTEGLFYRTDIGSKANK